jgi:aspartyl protease family protein
MIRFAIAAVLLIAAAIAVPMIYESHPEIFRSMPAQDAAPPLVASAPASKQPAPEVLQGRKMRLPADARGHYSGTFKMNGRAVEGMIDTGATLVAINESTARRIGITLKPADFRHEVSTANGKTRAAATTIREIQIGKVYARDVPAAVLNDRALGTTLVGLSFLQKITRYRVDGDGMVLEQ